MFLLGSVRSTRSIELAVAVAAPRASPLLATAGDVASASKASVSTEIGY